MERLPRGATEQARSALATTDADGVALARRFKKLKSANAAIERRLAALEQLMTNPNTKEN